MATEKPCRCGSGLPRRTSSSTHARTLSDARGIFCDFVCDKCEDEKRNRYRSDIFTDPNYWHDEPID